MTFKRLLFILLVMVYYFNLPIAKNKETKKTKNEVDKQIVTVPISKKCEWYRSFQMYSYLVFHAKTLLTPIDISVEQNSKIADLHQQWWPVYIINSFSRRTKNNSQIIMPSVIFSRFVGGDQTTDVDGYLCWRRQSRVHTFVYVKHQYLPGWLCCQCDLSTALWKVQYVSICFI